jgi:hypothetical protein
MLHVNERTTRKVLVAADWRTLYHDVSADEIMETVNQYWDFSYPLPLPRFTLACLCGSNRWQARLWLFWDRTDGGTQEHRVKWRCDTSLKCTFCGRVEIFGVPLTEDWVEYWGPQADIEINHRLGRKVLEETDRRVESGEVAFYEAPTVA